MRRRALTFVLATVVALGGVALVLAYAGTADRRAVAAQSPTTVWVSAKEVPTGTTLRAAVDRGLIGETTVAAKGAPAGALGPVTGANERLLAVSDIAPGEFVLAARFGTAPRGASALAVPKGMVAVAVALGDPARVGSFVTPGSRLAIFDTYKVRRLGDSAQAKAVNDADVHGTSVLLDDVLVIGVGDEPLGPAPSPDASPAEGTSGGGGSGGAGVLVTVAVTPRDAVRLVHATSTGSLYAALRGDGAGVDHAPRVDDLTLFDLSGVGR